jgi:hypothetical protein
MSALLYLSSEDFQIQKGIKGQLLCHNIPRFSLILFYSTRCTHCQTIIPKFKSLPGTIGGCQFGMVNVSNNKKCLMMSNQTITPIQYVPYIVLYNNGRPYMEYKGKHEIGDITNFIMQVAQKLQNKQQFSKEEVKDNNRAIPQYCLGNPLYGPDNKVCYLEFDNAYVKN